MTAERRQSGGRAAGTTAYHGRVPAEAPVVVSVLVGSEVRGSFALRWTNDVERGVLVTALGVVALDAGADSVVAARSGGGDHRVDQVAVVTGRGVTGPPSLVELVAPLQGLLPPNPGFRPLAVEVAAARRNLDG